MLAEDTTGTASRPTWRRSEAEDGRPAARQRAADRGSGCSWCWGWSRLVPALRGLAAPERPSATSAPRRSRPSPSLGVTVIGGALFLFASLARFLRLWLLRQLYEGQAHLDTLVAAVRER